mmetsp:Transcript_8644/g.24866  ORF Transcript_8644/g.24866 Transcript_8644/m.24866 type:complete len:190 (-) Transcript_8644:40-609(-)
MVGSLPTEIGHLIMLTRLEWNGAYTTGTLPTELGMLTKLTELNLAYANLSGTIPSELGNLVELYRLDLACTSVDGTIPDEFQSLTQLELFDVSGTQLSGSVVGNMCADIMYRGILVRYCDSNLGFDRTLNCSDAVAIAEAGLSDEGSCCSCPWDFNNHLDIETRNCILPLDDTTRDFLAAEKKSTNFHI